MSDAFYYLDTSTRVLFFFSGMPGAIYSNEDLFFGISGSVSFTGNDADENGGAIAIYRSNNRSIIGATFTSNQATNGGAVWVTSSDEEEYQLPVFGNLIFENNTAGSDGGALWLGTRTELWGSSFSKNLAGTVRVRTRGSHQLDISSCECGTFDGYPRFFCRSRGMWSSHLQHEP